MIRSCILVVILTFLLQGCFSREAQPQSSDMPYRVPGTSIRILSSVGSLNSGTNTTAVEVDSREIRQRVQTWLEEDECQFVQRGLYLTDVLVGINGMDLLEIVESMPEGFLNSPLYQERFPVEFYIDSNMPEEFIGPIDEVFSDWNREAGFEVFTNNGIYDNPNVITSKDQVDEEDQKNIIYWVMPEDERIFGTVDTKAVIGRVLPSSPLNSINDSNSFLPLNETNVFINGGFFRIFEEDVAQMQREELAELRIIYFKNVLRHEMGHTLGLANLSEDDVDITAQTQIPLMWYDIEAGLDPDNLALYIDNPLEVDRYVLNALSCAYDLEALRRQAQQP